jgi:enamine deaminase RidA (YjgF/YER057c/UK114 family)
LLSEECRSLDKEEKKSVRKDRTGYIDGMAAYAQNAADKGNMKELYDTVRKIFDAPVSRNVLVKDKNRKIITSVQEKLELWKEHFSEVLKSKYPHNINVETAQTCPELQNSIIPPSKRKIIEAIKAKKRGKAAGMDNIPAKILQIDPHLSAEMLYLLFLAIWKEERFPKNWKESIIVNTEKERL